MEEFFLERMANGDEICENTILLLLLVRIIINHQHSRVRCPCILGQVRSVSVCGFHRDTVEGGDVFQRRQEQGCFHQDVYSCHARPGAWERETRDRRRETVEMRDMALTSIYVQCTTWGKGKFELAIAGCASLGANSEAGRGSCQF